MQELAIYTDYSARVIRMTFSEGTGPADLHYVGKDRVVVRSHPAGCAVCCCGLFRFFAPDLSR